MPYKLTTFFVDCSGFSWKNVLPIEMGRGGLVDGEVLCSEVIIILGEGVFEDLS